MATIDNDNNVEWTANWTDDLTAVGLWSASSVGTFYGSKDFSSALSPASGATVRIPAGDFDVTLPTTSGDFQDAFAAALLDAVGGSGFDIYASLHTGAPGTNGANEDGSTNYARQQISAWT